MNMVVITRTQEEDKTRARSRFKEDRKEIQGKLMPKTFSTSKKTIEKQAQTFLVNSCEIYRKEPLEKKSFKEQAKEPDERTQ